ncbi:MAG: hypothetical protein ABIP74_00965, partial [Candidatus Saccharimonas sp.]
MSHREYAFGTDFGGVITPGGRDDTSDTSFFSDNYLNTPHLDHSFETLAALSTIYGDDMYVVSKCGPKI